MRVRARVCEENDEEGAFFHLALRHPSSSRSNAARCIMTVARDMVYMGFAITPDVRVYPMMREGEGSGRCPPARSRARQQNFGSRKANVGPSSRQQDFGATHTLTLTRTHTHTCAYTQ